MSTRTTCHRSPGSLRRRRGTGLASNGVRLIAGGSAFIVALSIAFAAPSAAGASTTHVAPRAHVVSASQVIQIAAGHANGCEVKRNGSLLCWGWNHYGELGNGTLRRSLVPIPVRGVAGARQVAIGFGHICTLLRSGRVLCWGWNRYGQVGDAKTVDAHVRTPVRGLSGVRSIALGFEHSCALLVSGQVKCWGWNYYGQLGDGTAKNASVPVAVKGLSGVVQIAAGYGHTCAVLRAGTVKCWGWNAYGQLGNGTSRSEERPVTVKGLAGVAGISLGFGHSCATLRSGASKCWGWNSYGMLGDGSMHATLLPTPVRALTDTTQLALGYGHSCALLRPTTVACWGWGLFGALGTGNIRTSTVPVAIRLSGVVQVVAGDDNTCALLAIGFVSCWGSNAQGQLGDGTTASSSRPPFTPLPPTNITAVPRNAAAVVRWHAPVHVGLGPVKSYVATAHPGGAFCTTKNLACTITNLTNGTAYAFTVAATNIAGTGVGSAPTARVTPFTKPDPPTLVAATRGNAAVLVSWRPGFDGGSPIRGYTATAADATNAARGHQRCIWVSGPTSCTVSGLTNGDSYTFTVQATNRAGASVPSAPSPVAVPASLPGSPTAVVATPGNASATVTWSAPGTNGGDPIVQYTVTAADSTTPANGGETCTWSSGLLTCTVTGLTNGDRYTFNVRARNGTGSGLPSSPSAVTVPRTTPGQPTGISATPGNTTAAVSWNAPSSDGGSTITGYTATAADSTTPGNGGQSCSWSSGPLRCTVTGLTNGDSYTFTVIATNVAGPGGASSPTAPVVPAGLPGTPTGVSANPSNGAADVSWSAPSSDGGSTIIGYTVTAADSTNAANGGETCGWTSGPLTCTVSGLTNGDSYTFTVIATNSVGNGSPSSPSASVVPATSPGPPQGVSATPGTGSALVSWSAPLSDGGSPITGYTATAADSTTPGNGGQFCVWSPGPLSCTVSGLTSGDVYTFTVTATNAVGTSTPSSPSSPVVALGVHLLAGGVLGFVIQSPAVPVGWTWIAAPAGVSHVFVGSGGFGVDGSAGVGRLRIGHAVSGSGGT